MQIRTDGKEKVSLGSYISPFCPSYWPSDRVCRKKFNPLIKRIWGPLRGKISNRAGLQIRTDGKEKALLGGTHLTLLARQIGRHTGRAAKTLTHSLTGYGDHLEKISKTGWGVKIRTEGNEKVSLARTHLTFLPRHIAHQTGCATKNETHSLTGYREY